MHTRFVTKLSQRFGKASTYGANAARPFVKKFSKPYVPAKNIKNQSFRFGNNRPTTQFQQAMRLYSTNKQGEFSHLTNNILQNLSPTEREAIMKEYQESNDKLKGFQYDKDPVHKLASKTPDHWGVKEPELKELHPNRDPRLYSYFTTFGVKTIAATGIRLAVLKYLYHLSATASQSSVAVVEVDLEPIPRGKTITISWRSKPVFIRHRSEKEQNALLAEGDNIESLLLRDPETDSQRFSNPEWTIVIAICTHLGCVPLVDSGAFDAFFCPCHGSHYDSSGRIRKGPAPLNLEVPEYKIEGNLLTLGS